MAGKLWSDGGIDALLARDGLYDIEVIARELNRTRGACERKLARLKGTAHKQYERDQVGNLASRETARAEMSR